VENRRLAGELVAPNGSIGFRWGEKGKWNLEQQAAGQAIELKLSLLDSRDDVVTVGFPTSAATKTRTFAASSRIR
jgi:nitrate reductase alpha subunit